jgi:hypothetical protein
VQPYRAADPVGTLAGWLVLSLGCQQLPNGSWRYDYSLRPGVVVSVIVAPGPDMVPPTDPAYLEVIRGLATARGPRL